MSQLDFFNTLPCSVSFNALPLIETHAINATSRFKLGEYPNFIEANEYSINAELQLKDGKCGDLKVTQPKWDGLIAAESGNVI